MATECHYVLWHSNWNCKPPEYLGIDGEKVDLRKLRAFYIASIEEHNKEMKKQMKKK